MFVILVLRLWSWPLLLFFVHFLFFGRGVGFADSHLWRGDVWHKNVPSRKEQYAKKKSAARGETSIQKTLGFHLCGVRSLMRVVRNVSVSICLHSTHFTQRDVYPDVRSPSVRLSQRLYSRDKIRAGGFCIVEINVNAGVRVAVCTKNLFMQQQQRCGNSRVTASAAAWPLVAKHTSDF